MPKSIDVTVFEAVNPVPVMGLIWPATPVPPQGNRVIAGETVYLSLKLFVESGDVVII